MLIYYTYEKLASSRFGKWVIGVQDASLDVDFHDRSSWIVPGTIDSDYNQL